VEQTVMYDSINALHISKMDTQRIEKWDWRWI